MIINHSMFNLLSDEEAQGLVEYSLILSLAALAVLGTFFVFRDALVGFYNEIQNEIEKI